MKIRRRTVLWIVAMGTVLIIGFPILFVGLYFVSTGGTGSADEAIRLKKIIERIPDPESGEGCDSEYAAKRFPNGEWVLGIGRDSHSMMSKYRGGGTVVVKDSRGRVRCFFGHVCGCGMQTFDARSLDEFYKKLIVSGGFKEVD